MYEEEEEEEEEEEDEEEKEEEVEEEWERGGEGKKKGEGWEEFLDYLPIDNSMYLAMLHVWISM